MPYTDEFGNIFGDSGPDELDLQNLPGYISGQDPVDLQNLPGYVSGQDPVDLQNLPPKMTGWPKFLDILKGFGGKALEFSQTPQGVVALLAALAARADAQGRTGGGIPMAYGGPKQMTRTMAQGAYGPIARYAANGGLMQAYANGGHVKMEDGGFVLTKKAVDGAGGPRGLASLVPGARMIGGPPDPTGRRDLTPASIHGPNGITPAKVSNGEAYVPKRHVDEAGGAKKMYALMNKLERRA